MARKKGTKGVPDIVKTTAAGVLSKARKKDTDITAPALKKKTEDE